MTFTSVKENICLFIFHPVVHLKFHRVFYVLLFVNFSFTFMTLFFLSCAVVFWKTLSLTLLIPHLIYMTNSLVVISSDPWFPFPYSPLPSHRTQLQLEVLVLFFYPFSFSFWKLGDIVLYLIRFFSDKREVGR